MILTATLLIAGLVLLIVGGELLVRGAVHVAAALGVSPLVIGLTLVGFGTSTPELVTSIQAALAGSPGIAYGNIVGSNIANLLLIGGVSALLFPVVISSAALRRDGAVMLASAGAFALLAFLMPMGRVVGVCLVLALALYVYAVFRQERTQTAPATHVTPAAPGLLIARSSLIALIGLGLVIAGSSLLVDGAVSLSRALGVSETVIGLTVVAVGTSMPELVTSVVAALRRQTDVAFGNIVGSNICNVLGIGGMTALIAPSAVPPQIVSFDNPVMLAVSLLFVAVAWTGFRIERWEGLALLAFYALYVVAIWPA